MNILSGQKKSAGGTARASAIRKTVSTLVFTAPRSADESVLSTSDEEFHEVLPPRFFGLPAVVADAAPA